MAQIRVLSPVGIVQAQTVAVPALPQSWNGRTVGFLDNTKSNFDRLVGDLGALLRERYGVAAVVHRKKANASTPASRALRESAHVYTGVTALPAASNPQRPCQKVVTPTARTAARPARAQTASRQVATAARRTPGSCSTPPSAVTRGS